LASRKNPRTNPEAEPPRLTSATLSFLTLQAETFSVKICQFLNEMSVWKRAPWVSSGAESALWVFVVLLIVGVVRRIEAVGNYLPLYIDI
jgi:hypothetical protein